MRNIGIKLVTLGMLTMAVMAPMSASADVHRTNDRIDLKQFAVGVLDRVFEQQGHDRYDDRDRDRDRNWNRNEDRDRNSRRDDRRDDKRRDDRNDRR